MRQGTQLRRRYLRVSASAQPSVFHPKPGLSLRVLFVEDCHEDVLLALRELRQSGYRVTHERVETRAGLEAALDGEPWDVLLCDHALPTFSDAGCLAVLRERRLDLPLLIVSGSIGEEHAVDAMRAGAHDYIMKGNLKRLVPAIERELREVEARRVRRQAELALKQAEENVQRLAAIVESSDDAITSMSPDGAILTWNRGAERLYGYAAAEVIGLPITIVVQRDHVDEVRALVDRVARDEHVPCFESHLTRKDGRNVAVLLTLSSIRDAEGVVVGVSAIGRDITERKRFEAQLRHLAEHDALTGLPNRRRFEADLGRLVELSKQTDTAVAIAVIDLDNFKHVNDSLGHKAGDELIRSVAGLLKRRLRADDVVARLGGDEFALLLDGVSAEDAEIVMQKLLAGVREHALVVRGRRL